MLYKLNEKEQGIQVQLTAFDFTFEYELLR